MSIQPTGGQPSPESVVDQMIESGQTVLLPNVLLEFGVAFEKYYAEDKSLCDTYVQPPLDGRAFYRLAFQAGWLAACENARRAGR